MKKLLRSYSFHKTKIRAGLSTCRCFIGSGAFLAGFLVILSCVWIISATGIGWLYDELPADERTALIELEEGFFDSASWDRLQFFYTQPLCVPLGELRYLHDILPDLPDDLPVKTDVLSGYEPWSADNVIVFFKDYPYLVPFRALLSFETDKVSSFAHVAFFSRMSGLSRKFYQSVRFTATPVKRIRADGTVFFEDTYARWRRRRLLLNVPHVGNLQIGNFSFTMNRGLFYGYFPGSSVSLDTVKYNWLYGTSRTWNGFSSATPFGRKNKVYTLVHRRETESIVGLKTACQVGPVVSLYGALSGALIDNGDDTNDTSVTCHGGIAASLGAFKLSLETGSPLLDAFSAPLYATVSHKGQKQAHALSCIRIPAGFYAPRSSLLRSCFTRLEVEDSTAEKITGMALSVTGDWWQLCRQRISLSYVTGGNRADCKASYKITGMEPCVYSLLYSLSANNYTGKIRHRISLSGAYDTKTVFSVASSVSYNVNVDAYWRFKADIQPCFKLFSTLQVAPCVTFCTNSAARHDLAFGIYERINFFERSYGEVTFTIPVISSYQETYSLYAKAHFLF